MKKQNREVVDSEQILDILSRCPVVCLSFFDKDYPYTVPLNFGYRTEDGILYLYFHCAKEGKKLTLADANPNVCFAASCSHAFEENAVACKNTYYYESVMGTGRFERIPAQRTEEALTLLLSHYSSRGGYEYQRGALAAVTVFRVAVSSISAKRHAAPKRSPSIKPTDGV